MAHAMKPTMADVDRFTSLLKSEHKKRQMVGLIGLRHLASSETYELACHLRPHDAL